MTDVSQTPGPWIGWNGGECPLHPRTKVEAIVQYWRETRQTPPKQVRDLNWAEKAPERVIAYRVVEEYSPPRLYRGKGQPELIDPADVRLAMDGGGFWRDCSGCHEGNEGYPTGPYSHALQCHLGFGCHECGGIGAVWTMGDQYGAEIAPEGPESQQNKAETPVPMGASPTTVISAAEFLLARLEEADDSLAFRRLVVAACFGAEQYDRLSASPITADAAPIDALRTTLIAIIDPTGPYLDDLRAKATLKQEAE